jgi:nucleoside-diphosphate-sugar epimerase
LTSPGILIAGGSGFIGRALAATCLDMGWRVTVLSRQSHSPPANTGARQIECDVRDPRALKESLSGESFDYAVNCAGYIDHALGGAQARETFATHFHGLENLVEVLDQATLKGFVQIGSSDEYGGAPAPQREDLREAPISPYSLAKTAAAHYVQMLHRNHGFPGVVLRLFLVYGPGQDARRFIPQIMRGCRAGSRFETSEGGQLRDFCYIDDVVAGILKALETPAARGEVINLGSGEPRSIRSVIDDIVSLAGKGEPVYGARSYRPGESMALYPDITKARTILNWQPETEFREGLARTFRYNQETGT